MDYFPCCVKMYAGFSVLTVFNLSRIEIIPDPIYYQAGY